MPGVEGQGSNRKEGCGVSDVLGSMPGARRGQEQDVAGQEEWKGQRG